MKKILFNIGLVVYGLAVMVAIGTESREWSAILLGGTFIGCSIIGAYLEEKKDEKKKIS